MWATNGISARLVARGALAGFLPPAEPIDRAKKHVGEYLTSRVLAGKCAATITASPEHGFEQLARAAGAYAAWPGGRATRITVSTPSKAEPHTHLGSDLWDVATDRARSGAVTTHVDPTLLWDLIPYQGPITLQLGEASYDPIIIAPVGERVWYSVCMPQRAP
jgi:hypothetical protein